MRMGVIRAPLLDRRGGGVVEPPRHYRLGLARHAPPAPRTSRLAPLTGAGLSPFL